jgi:hypothetical protein
MRVVTQLALAVQTVATQDSMRRDTVAVDSVVVESPLPGGPAAVARFLFSTVPQWIQIAGVFLGAAVALALLVVVWRRRTRILAWFTAKSRGWKLGFAAIVLVALGGVGFAGLKSWNFMMHDNRFCSGCHVMKTPFQRFASAESHGDLSCHDCHRQGMSANVRQLYQWVAERPDRIGEHAPVPNHICNECHNQTQADSVWKRIASTAGHQIHQNPRSPALERLSCVACHGKEVHRFKSTENNCATSGCHDQIKIELGKMAAAQTRMHCTMCHQFSATTIASNPVDSARGAMRPGEEQCLSCHQMQQRMKEFRPETDPHNGECGLCHNPHSQTTIVGAYQSCATSNCHARSDTLTAMHRGLTGRHKLENCGACHVAHTWKVGRTDCRACHSGITDPAVQTRRPDESPSPHSAPRNNEPPTPDPLIPASFRGHRQAVPAFSRHAAGRSQWRRHTERPTQPALTLRPVALPVATEPFVSPGGDSTAQFAHANHRSVSCTTCHTSDVSHGGLKVSVARRCTACHHANTAVGNDCQRCHRATELTRPLSMSVPVRLTVSHAPQTKTLAFEHARHGRLECSTCHAATLARTVEKTCASCHADHHEATRTCTTCHTPSPASHPRTLHVTGCGGSGCHTTEATAAVTPARAVCVACHVKQADHKPGRDCASCHLSQWRSASRSGR